MVASFTCCLRPREELERIPETGWETRHLTEGEKKKKKKRNRRRNETEREKEKREINVVIEQGVRG